MQPKNNKILLLIFSIFIGISFSNAQDIPVKRPVIEPRDSITHDDIKIDSIKLPKERLEALIRDKSKDY